MAFTFGSNRKLYKSLGESGAEFLEYGLNAITRVLPHIETADWQISTYEPTRVTWASTDRRELNFVVGLKLDPSSDANYSVRGVVRRRGAAKSRTLDTREQDICKKVAEKLTQILGPQSANGSESLAAIRTAFDERIVAAHLKSHHKLEIDPGKLFSKLRTLAEQTYENKSLTFGCILDPEKEEAAQLDAMFPDDFLTRKKYRALSDGYRTAYVVSKYGTLIEFIALESNDVNRSEKVFFPEWCRDLALMSRGTRIGICLTKHGDLLVLDGGNLRFTYRFGQWQYWNHAHLINLLHDAARVQRVPKEIIPRVIRSVYRAALDVSFRRSGGLFVLLRNSQQIRQLVREGDSINDGKRLPLDRQFDKALPSAAIQNMPRSLVVELASLDGAIVLNNKGELLAYGTVLEPKRHGRIAQAEGSRTKAAIGASKYGMAVKISSDGDITVFVNGEKFIQV